jgi:hypothetical protein
MFYASGDHVHYIEVIEAREQKLRAMIRAFQDERDSGKSQHQWQRIEKEVFGMDYDD